MQVNTATIFLVLSDLFHRFSTLKRPLQTTARILRFLLYRRHSSDTMKPVLAPLEIHSASLAWIRHKQHHYFGAEIQILTSGKNKLDLLIPYLNVNNCYESDFV